MILSPISWLYKFKTSEIKSWHTRPLDSHWSSLWGSPSLYCIPQLSILFQFIGSDYPIGILHWCPYRHHYTGVYVEFVKSILEVVKSEIQGYCDKWWGVKYMRIMNKIIGMLKYIQWVSSPLCNIIKTFYFFTIYTAISHSKLKHRISKHFG